MNIYGIELMGKILRAPIKDHSVKLLLVALAQSTNEQGETKPISNTTLQKLLNRTENPVREIIEKAEGSELLSRIENTESTGRRSANSYRINVSAILAMLSGTEDTPLSSGGYTPLNSGGQPMSMSQGQPMSMSEGQPPCMQGGQNVVPIKEHARARAVSENSIIHELNHELNSGEKISTGRKKSSPFESNSSKAAAFEVTTELRAWAEKHCPLVQIETTTQAWREFVCKMETKLITPPAHWRDFVKEAQRLLEIQAKERAEALVGAGSSYQVRGPVGSGTNGAAVRLAENRAASVAPLFDDSEAQREAAIEQALSRLTADELENRRAEILAGLRARVGDKFYLWTEDAITATVDSTLRKQVAAELVA